jgi:hypothetical protein
MCAPYPEEAKNFRLVGHDPSAAWGGGSLVQIHKGHAYVGAVGGSSFNGPEGFTVHDVRDPRQPKKVGEFRAPPGVHCHKLRIVGDDLLYVNSERLAGDKGKNVRAGFFIFDVSTPSAPKPVGFYDMPGSGPHRFGVDLKRHLAFMPNDAPGWDKRVIWTLDIRDPLHPEVVSIWGLPWMKTDTNEVGNDPHEEATTLHGPPMIRGNRMYCAWWGGGMSIIDCTDLTTMKLVGHIMVAAVSGLDAHLLADRRSPLSRRHRRGARQGKILGRAIHVDHRCAGRNKSAAHRDLHAGAGEIFRPARPVRRPQHSGRPPGRRTVEEHRVSHVLQCRAARGQHQRPAASEGSGLLRARDACRRAGHPVERHRRRRRRPPLSDRPLGPGHAHSGTYWVTFSARTKRRCAPE